MSAILKPQLPFTKWRKQAFYSLYNVYLKDKLATYDVCDEEIKKGLMGILPNISTEMANENDETYLEDWIQKALSYTKTLVYDFEDICSRQVKSLDIIRNHTSLSKRFDCEKIRILPLEIEKYIQSYFLPRTRLDILIHSTPNIEDRINKMTLPWLNNIVKYAIWFNIKKMQSRFCRVYKNNPALQKRCQDFYTREICQKLLPESKKKKHIMEIIMNILFLHKTLDNYPSNYMAQRLHKTIFRIWHSVLYVESKYLDKKNRL
jgi:hypothetical protein